VIALHPNLVVVVITPFDLSVTQNDALQQGLTHSDDLSATLKAILKQGRLFSVMQHYLYREPDGFVRLFLHYGDRAAFMRFPLSADWQARLTRFDANVHDMADWLKAVGIPLLIAYVPEQAQAYIVAKQMNVPAIQSTTLDQANGAIAEANGSLYTDTTLAFKGIADPQDYFYRADGHLNGAGQTVVGEPVARTILKELPSFCHDDGKRHDQAAKR